jgi:hypothetical protein
MAPSFLNFKFRYLAGVIALTALTALATPLPSFADEVVVPIIALDQLPTFENSPPESQDGAGPRIENRQPAPLILNRAVDDS